MYICWVTALILNFNQPDDIAVIYYYPLRILTTIVIYILGYQGIRQLRILKERKALRLDIKTDNYTNETDDFKTPKSEKQYLKTEKQFKDIDNHIREKQKYLTPKYTLQNLSSELEIGTSTLSAIINNQAGKSFIEYINEMRVEQAKKILIDSKYSNYTIVAVGLESGFNSKSTFYNVFKKHTGKTPLAYKETKLTLKLS